MSFRTLISIIWSKSSSNVRSEEALLKAFLMSSVIIAHSFLRLREKFATSSAILDNLLDSIYCFFSLGEAELPFEKTSYPNDFNF